MHENHQKDSTKTTRETLIGLIRIEISRGTCRVVGFVWKSSKSFVGERGLRHWLWLKRRERRRVTHKGCVTFRVQRRVTFDFSICVAVRNGNANSYLLSVLRNIEWRICLFLWQLFRHLFVIFFENFLKFCHFLWVTALVEILEGGILCFDVFRDSG